MGCLPIGPIIAGSARHQTERGRNVRIYVSTHTRNDKVAQCKGGLFCARAFGQVCGRIRAIIQTGVSAGTCVDLFDCNTHTSIHRIQPKRVSLPWPQFDAVAVAVYGSASTTATVITTTTATAAITTTTTATAAITAGTT